MLIAGQAVGAVGLGALLDGLGTMVAFAAAAVVTAHGRPVRSVGRMDPRPLPAVGAPATRALEDAGVHDVDDVRRVGLNRLATLHGVGPKALRLLQQALDADDPAP
ncbi:hypothetical protein [Rathayibacter sp. AY1H3]|nr:hypothetical protein [Rathayibacter sp. AY1H3]